jgi:hypothetical protein
MMAPRPVFVTRQSPDWREIAADFGKGRRIDPARFRPREPISRFPDEIVDLIGLWNAHFRVDFFNCRARLQEISNSYFARLAAARRFRHDDADLGRKIGAADLVFFHDDDDWFSPEADGIVAAITGEDFDVVVFPLIRLWTDTVTFVRETYPSRVAVGRRSGFGFRYHSNNYGVRGSICDPAALVGMKQHIAASEFADKRALRDLYVDQIISGPRRPPARPACCPFCSQGTETPDPARGTTSAR